MARKLKGYGLALSGGGYRASLFHLGATRRLHELGVLQKITTLSSVSGGSIFAGFLAECMLRKDRKWLVFDDWDEEIAVPFRKFVRRDVRTGLIVRHVAWNWLNPGLRAAGLEKMFRKRLTDRKLVELPRKGEGVEFYFLATNIKTGVMWKFTAEDIGDYLDKTESTPQDMDIATAVTASACFPPVFGPIKIDRGEKESWYLTDGGVYDNSGMEPVWDTKKVVLVSDAGAPFAASIPKTAAGRLLRYVDIGRNQVGARRRLALRARIDENYRGVRVYDDVTESGEPRSEDCDLRDDPSCFMRTRRVTDKAIGTFWRLGGVEEAYVKGGSAAFQEELQTLRGGWYGYSQDAENTIDSIRTDLDSFTTAEAKILENHGYWWADLATRRFVKGRQVDDTDIADFSVPFSPPNAYYLDDGIVEKALKKSDSALYFWKRWFNK